MQFILEILTEDIPASMQKQAVIDAKNLFEKLFSEIKYKDMKVYISKERITLTIEDLEKQCESKTISKRGPKEKGPSLDHFMKSVGVASENDLIVEKGHFVYTKQIDGDSVYEFIPKMLKEFLKQMPWPKSMKWHNESSDTQTIEWVRPIRQIACVYDQKPIIFKIDGLDLTTCGHTRGNRFTSNNPIKIDTIENYKDSLRKCHVIIDQDERMDMLKEQLLKTNADIDNELLEETLGLVDFPFVITAKIDEEFLDLPKIVLKTVMKVHQKYFTISGSNSFAVVTDLPNAEKTIEGHKRVLRSRLKDAKFFFELDKKTTLLEKVEELKKVIYHEKLGTVFDKVKRLESLMRDELHKKAAILCKADIVTNLVKELPELQGHMGKIYSNDDEVGDIILDHLSLDPSISKELALRDKLDALVGFFKIGIKPSGSKDPYALRRAALVVIRILIKNKDYKILSELLDETIQSYGHEFNTAKNDVHLFIEERFKFLLKNFEIEVLDTSFLKDESLYSAFNRLESASKAITDPCFLQLYKRVLGFEEIKSIPEKKDTLAEEFEKLLESDLIKNFEFQKYINKLKTLTLKAKEFLDTVTVLSDDLEEKQMHLFTISKIRQAFLVIFRGII